MSASVDLGAAVIASLDESALERLAELLAPRLAGKLAVSEARESAWLDSQAAAEHLCMSRAAVYRLASERRIPFSQSVAGGKLWFRRAELDEWRTRGG
jgi:excisionase family DNA binding protein